MIRNICGRRGWSPIIWQGSKRCTSTTSAEHRAWLNIENIRVSVANDSPMPTEYQKMLDTLLSSISQTLRPASKDDQLMGLAVNKIPTETQLYDGVIGALNRDIGVDIRSHIDVGEGGDALFPSLLALEQGGRISFDRKSLIAPTTEFFREAMDRLMVTFNLRSRPGRRQLIELIITEALLMRHGRSATTPATVRNRETENDNASSRGSTNNSAAAVDGGKLNTAESQRYQQLLSRLNVGVHPEIECSIDLPCASANNNDGKLVQRLQGRIDYLTTPHFTRRQISQPPQYSSRALCAIILVQPQDDLSYKFHANRLLFQTILHSALHPPQALMPMDSSADGPLLRCRPLNVCLTDGFRWQFTRFYPYNDLPLIGDYNYSGGKLGDLMREYPQLKENTDSTDPIGYQLSLANHLLIHRMHGCPDYLLKSSVAEMQKLTELLASEAYEKATSAADDNNRLAVKYFTSDVYDLLSNDGPFVLAILQWWLRGLTPFRGAFHIE